MADVQIKAALTESAKEDRSKQARAYWMRVGLAVLALIVVAVIVNIAAHGAFLQPANLIRVLRQITYNCILGVGQTFVIITAGIDLSVGSVSSVISSL